MNRLYSTATRQGGYDDFLGATRDFYGGELNRQKEQADRSLKFAMARSGLSGGSASVDANRRLGEDYQRGVLDAERLAQGALADLQASDETSRQNLLSQVAGGMSLTSGATQSAQAMQGNMQAAQGRLRADPLGEIFGGLADVYSRSRESACDRDQRQLPPCETRLFDPDCTESRCTDPEPGYVGANPFLEVLAHVPPNGHRRRQSGRRG